MVAGFIAALKLAVTTVLEHAPMAALRGVTEPTVGAVTVGLAPGLSYSLHPVETMSIRSAGNQILELLYLRMNFILLLSAFTAAANT
jgi:hypothetical protein